MLKIHKWHGSKKKSRVGSGGSDLGGNVVIVLNSVVRVRPD